ncbi:hypothetical protein J6590_089854, partial [Homalodisca vitripennis]
MKLYVPSSCGSILEDIRNDIKPSAVGAIITLTRDSCITTCNTDFSKAFDRVGHEHLVAKLEAIGLSGSLLMWLKSYLRDRPLR